MQQVVEATLTKPNLPQQLMVQMKTGSTDDSPVSTTLPDTKMSSTTLGAFMR